MRPPLAILCVRRGSRGFWRSDLSANPDQHRDIDLERRHTKDMNINNVFILMPHDDSGDEEDQDQLRQREAEAERIALRTRGLPERWRLMPLAREQVEHDAGELSIWIGIIGTLIVLFMAGWAVIAVERQARTVGFTPITGVIVESDLKKTDFVLEEQAYKVVKATVLYDYVIGDQPYTNDQIRYGLSAMENDAAREFHETHPIGAPVTVYYNPANPQSSVLQTGLHRQDHLSLWFGIACMCTMIAWWMWLIPHRMAANGRRPAGGVQIRTYGPCINSRMTTLPPIAVALGVGIMVITTGLILLIATRPDLSPIAWVSLTLLTAIALGTLVGWAWAWLYRAERHWLTIDTERQFIITQGMGEMMPPREVPLKEIAAVTLGRFEPQRSVSSPIKEATEEDATDDGKSLEDAGDDENLQNDDTPAPPGGTLVLLHVRDVADPRPLAVPAASFSNAVCAIHFAHWLSDQIGRPMTWREETKPATGAAADHETQQVGGTG